MIKETGNVWDFKDKTATPFGFADIRRDMAETLFRIALKRGWYARMVEPSSALPGCVDLTIHLPVDISASVLAIITKD